MTHRFPSALAVAWSVAAMLLSGCASPAMQAGAGPGPAPAGAGSLRVVTWNIFAGNDLDRQSNLAGVAAVLDSLGADFALLQEVDRGTTRSGGVDQPAVLAERTGMHVVFGRAMDFDGGEYGVAVLSRWPVLSFRVVPLDVDRPAELAERYYEPRVLLHVVADGPAGEVHVLNTHVDHGREPVFRHPQLFGLLAWVADSVPPGAVVVLGGDLNAMPAAPEVRALGVAFTDAWRACGDGDGHTFRSDRPDRRIDYVLLAGAHCTAARVLDSRLSDHRPVVVDVRRP
ncbi:MAG TPA: endonuclease/exonuclease/phosphatase family protein [Longimicrobiales bacterium]|nr:endonuclease/exonuclease/phosphatase family protein [Longimicrobiales bacterium]